MARTCQEARSARGPGNPLVVFPAMSNEDHAALREFWQQASGLFWQQSGSLPAGFLRRGVFERLVRCNLSLSRLATCTPKKLHSYLGFSPQLPATDVRTLIEAAKVFPRHPY